MMKIGCCLALSALLLFASLAAAEAEDPGPRIAGDRVLVKVSPAAAESAVSMPENDLPRGIPGMDAFLQKHGIEIGHRVARAHGVPVGDTGLFREVGLDRWYTLYLPTPGLDGVRALVGELHGQPWVEWADAVPILELHGIPNDTYFGQQWHHHNTGQTGGTVDADMDSPEAWDLWTGDATGVIGMIDSGIEHTHEDLAANIGPGWDFIHDDDYPEEEFEHGTATSGAAAAISDNGIGVAGVCGACRIMMLKVIGASGEGTTDDIVDAIRWGADNGADVLASTTGGYFHMQALEDAVEYAEGRGSIVLCSAGNMNAVHDVPLATTQGVVSVGGSGQSDNRLMSHGDHADVTGPAVDIYTTAPGNSYGASSGTSFSSPLAGGLVGLLRSRDDTLHVNELRHLLQLGAEDQVGAPEEDTPGWDRYMGWGRINAYNSLSMIDGPWLALDRPHYLCAGDLQVSLKDKTAGGTVDVTLTGDVGGDTETVTVLPVAGASGYYEGTIPLSWAGKDGPVVTQDGKLDVAHGENVTASVGGMTATAFIDCLKEACLSPKRLVRITGDCDRDGAADPGELWSIEPVIGTTFTAGLPEAVAVLTTEDPHVELVDDTVDYGLLYITTFYPEPSMGGEPGRIRVRAGAPMNHPVELTVSSIHGLGWENDPAACIAKYGTQSFTIRANRDLGSEQDRWDFDGGTAEGFTPVAAHGTGDLSECDSLLAWRNDWSAFPVTDRSHSGAFSMRLGDGVQYESGNDAGLTSPVFTAPVGGGAVAFYTWVDSELHYRPERAMDGMVVEAKSTGSSIWSYLPDGTYFKEQYPLACGDYSIVPFGNVENADLFAGDGDGTTVTGDSFDRRHVVSLDPVAGTDAQVRFRVGTNMLDSNTGIGFWIDTVTVHPWTADSWPGDAPSNLQGSDVNCPSSYDLTWDPVAGAGSYNIYRSELSCTDASGMADPYDSSTAASYSDAGVVENVDYFYAVEALEAGQGCPTERSCIPGNCICVLPADPTQLRLEKSGDDVLLSWDDPGIPGMTWNVYRDENRDPATWGSPHATGVTDEDAGTPGVQYTDAGAVPAGSPLYYLVTAVDACGESELR